ncbi:DUF4142 domain-containing protein [Hydrogenophaga sp.]|uniref:DUF4142 domain-containing protein n=1 Tax=Hydrogenophaga sp. TaxID=1904254 RepID=UPI003D0FA232
MNARPLFQRLLLAATLLFGALAQAQPQPLETPDQDFLEQAAHNARAEMSAGRLALTKARHPRVRTFAQRMIDEHTLIDTDLRALATDHGFDPPQEPSALQKGKEMMIGGLGDDTFDRRYMNQMGVEAHTSYIQLFENAARDARHPDVKAFASRHLRTLREHLEIARSLKAEVDRGNTPAK